MSQQKSEIEKDMFEFSRRRVKEIESKVNTAFKNAEKFRAMRATKLDNEAAVTNEAGLQRELLNGRYSINLAKSMPYSRKIVKMS